MFQIIRQRKNNYQSGTTLLEMMVVLLIIGLLSGLSINWMFYDHHREQDGEFEKENALVWFDHARSIALYDSRPYRLCLSLRHIALEKYTDSQKWIQVKTYTPTNDNIVFHWQGDNCSGPLNTGIKLFWEKVKFEKR